MNIQTEEALIQGGLTKNERVYLALLKLGSATAVEITKKSKVHRVNVYDVLERLREKGLISTIFESNKRIYESANPDQLIQLIKEKEELLADVLPTLKQEFALKKEKQQVYHFFGPEGVMRAYYMMLEQNATIYGLGGSGLNRKYLMHRHHMWNKERINKKISVVGLYYESSKIMKEKPGKNTLIKRKYLPDKFKTIGMIDICGDLVVNLLPIEDNIMAIVIENKILADTYKKFFEFMWQFAKS
ncbi:hypothetical protein GF323_02435 [Candidatus Woesearchaeota archaeon]|nr:hypothetical protein [Candidatus Woesearchaeota archaeon]